MKPKNVPIGEVDPVLHWIKIIIYIQFNYIIMDSRHRVPA